MISQCLFKIATSFRPGALDAGRALSLSGYINQFSMLRDTPWVLSQPEIRSLGNAGSLGRQLYEAIEQGLSCAAYRGSDEFLWIRERLVFRSNVELNLQDFEVEILLPAENQQETFCTFADQLKLSDLNYVPKFLKGYAQDVHGLLWCACERDFSKLKDGPEAKELMRSLAKVLPHLTNYLALPSPEGAPARLGWLNYWSPRVASAVGFPDPIQDSPILPLCRQFDDGAWFVKLTADPLDLQRPDHVAALAWAYQRFDKIGRRRTPEQEAAKKAAKRLKKAKEQAELDRAKALHPSFAVYAPQRKGAYGKASAIHAPTSEDALRIFFARGTKGRLPKPRETLAQLAAAWDEMASAMGDPLAAEFVAEPPLAADSTQAASEIVMPEVDYAHIAQSALQCWDMNVTEFDEAELHVTVVDMLADEGFSVELAEQAYALIEPAWAEVEGRSYSITPQQARSPLFLAMLNEIRTGGWDIAGEA